MNAKYRKCVGMMILNTNNEILVGRRLDHPSGYWQMPQGGIDENATKDNSEDTVLSEKEKRLAKDYQLQRALDLLKGLSIFEESFEE